MTIREEALSKLQRYCAYQERCHSEVRTKLINLKVYGEILEDVISELIRDDFLNEQRYAETFTGGKFRIKKWGRIKITTHLKVKKVSIYCIRKGMAVINDDDYIKTLRQVAKKYIEERKSKDWSKIEMNRRCIKHCQNRGFEYPLIKTVLDKF